MPTPLNFNRDLTEFRRRLAETASWCAPLVTDPQVRTWSAELEAAFYRSGTADSLVPWGTRLLRSPKLRPDGIVTEEWPRMFGRDESARVELVDRLALQRRRLLAERRGPAGIADPDLEGGRFLLYDPDANLCDGCAQLLSGGFFDVDNVPPWDTWLAHIEDWEPDPGSWEEFTSFLVAWVPPALAKAADFGVWGNPEVCITWATEIDTPFTRQLEAADLLGGTPFWRREESLAHEPSRTGPIVSRALHRFA